MRTKTYGFDNIFGPETEQLQVYEETVAPCVDEVLDGCVIDSGISFKWLVVGVDRSFIVL
jgi:hypothetical protein